MALGVTKAVDIIGAQPGEIVTYTVDVAVTTSAETNVELTDDNPDGAEFISGSVKIDGISDASANPNNGIDLGTIAAGDTVTVEYKCKIDPQASETTITNTASVVSSETTTAVEATATVDVLVIDVVKTADVEFVELGDTITYTVEVTNNGEVDINNIVLKDIIPKGTSFVTDSVYIDGTNYPGEDPTSPDGIDVSSFRTDPLAPGETVVITFQVKVDNLLCCTNCAFVSFTYDKYEVDDDAGEKTIKACVDVELLSCFKQLSVDENVTIPPQKPDSEQVLNVVVNVVITEVNVIETIVATSEEGQILTGFKAIVEGRLNQTIEYVADEPTQSVHVTEYSIPFSSYIVLPPDFVLGTPIEVEPFVEDVYYKQLDKRTIFKNITFRLLAKYCK